MLIDFTVQNYTSFNQAQSLNLLAGKSKDACAKLNNTVSIDKLGVDSIVKSAVLFGANASGKSNLVGAIEFFLEVVLGSFNGVKGQLLDRNIPFLLKNNHFDEPTEFEITFIAENKLYRYGLAIDKTQVKEEWLFWTNKSRETMLFHRTGQQIEFNNRSFKEAKLFVSKENCVEKTRPNVPFLSVIAQFDGEKSAAVTRFLSQIKIISGLTDDLFAPATIALFENDHEFKQWALSILKSLQIEDIVINEIQTPSQRIHIDDQNINQVSDTSAVYTLRNTVKSKTIEVVKIDVDTGAKYQLPLQLESDGTKKLLSALGPLYRAIRHNQVLVIDEFDSKFHSLLSKFVLDLFHRQNTGYSQLIATCHDTQLLSNEIFRRDQIWFVEKNRRSESQLYSLVEYKEYYSRKDGSYAKDYLQGKYGAIPLFASLEALGALFDGQE